MKVLVSACIIVALAFASARCSRRLGLAFDQGSFTGVARSYDSLTGSYKLNYSFTISASDANDFDWIEIREVDTTVYASSQATTCTVGIPVQSWNSPFTAGQKISGFYLAGAEDKFRYVFCLKKSDGTTLAWADGQSAPSAAGVSELATSGTAISSTTYTASKISSGQYFTCVLFSNGRIKCWGLNDNGQLGQGDTSDRGDSAGEMGASLSYVELGTSGSDALAAIDIGAGYHHTCALFNNGKVKCWGANDKGQLGLEDTDARGDQVGEMGDSLPFVNLGTGLTAKSIAISGDFSCALLSNNTVKCWGENSSGQLGRGDVTVIGGLAGEMGDGLAPIDLGTGRTAKSIAAGLEHVCAILDTNQVKCWGLNDSGQLGLGDLDNRGDDANEMGDHLPVVKFGGPAEAKGYASAISAGASHSCVTTWSFQIKC